MEKQIERNHGADLIKIIAIFLVVLCHVTETVRNNDLNILVQYESIFKSYQSMFSLIDAFALYFFRSFGHLGNVIFIVCSSWYLYDKKTIKSKKVFDIVLNVFVISLLFLLLYLVKYKNIPGEYIIRSIFPTTFANNWYLTVYALIYIMCPILNSAIDKTNRKDSLRIIALFIFLYYFVDFVGGTHYYLDKLTNVMLLYVLTCYLKKYHFEFCNNTRKQTIIFLISTILHCGIYFIRYFFIEFSFELYNLNNPIMLLMGFSLFCIFNNLRIKSPIKGLISLLSTNVMFVYLFHENILFRNISRVEIVRIMFETLGVRFIALKTVILSLMIIVLCFALSILYRKTIGKLVSVVSEKIGDFCDDTLERVCNE